MFRSEINKTNNKWSTSSLSHLSFAVINVNDWNIFQDHSRIYKNNYGSWISSKQDDKIIYEGYYLLLNQADLRETIVSHKFKNDDLSSYL
jgi:hypothetical protein